MIPQAAITAWRNNAPWASPDQVEHDLVLSRAICELYLNDVVTEAKAQPHLLRTECGRRE